MARPTKAQRLQKKFELALIEFNRSWAAQIEERRQCMADRRFYSIPGAMWEGALGDQYKNKIKLEVNKIHLAIIRIFSEYRNNRISVTFSSDDGSTDKDQLADTCAGLHRADEQFSDAEEAYDNAYEEATGGGIGAWRYRPTYEDDEDEDEDEQRILIEPIHDADLCVFFNIDAKRQDKSDAKRCWVLVPYTRENFLDEWPDQDPTTWPKPTTVDASFDWAPANTVWVAEYYEIEKVSSTTYVYETITGEEETYTDDDFENNPELEQQLESYGSKLVETKKTKGKKKVHKYFMSGGGIIEDCGQIAGKYIPIAVTYGKRWVVNNIERCMGHGRLAADVSRLKNMMISKLAEISAQPSNEKPIFTPEEIAGHAQLWADDPVENYPYLLRNSVKDQNGNPLPLTPVQYTKPPDIPPALAALLQLTDQDMKDMLGNQEQGEEMQPNMSGRAVELIQQRLDMQSFIYIDNMKKARRHGGKIWLSIAKDILVKEGRKMKVISEQGEASGIELLRKAIGKNGVTVVENDLREAKFGVTVDVGPSSTTKRASTVRALTGMASITDDPQDKSVLISSAMMNMDGEGLMDVRRYFRKKLLVQGIGTPTDQEKQDIGEALQNQQPDAQTQYLQSAARAEDANAAKANADTVAKVAAADKMRAETAQILSTLDQSKVEHLFTIMRELGLLEPTTQQPS